MGDAKQSNGGIYHYENNPSPCTIKQVQGRGVVFGRLIRETGKKFPAS